MNIYGIEYVLVDAIRKAVKAQHPQGMQVATICACGSPGGGPAMTPACRALKELLERSKTLAWLERP